MLKCGNFIIPILIELTSKNFCTLLQLSGTWPEVCDHLDQKRGGQSRVSGPACPFWSPNPDKVNQPDAIVLI